MAITTKAGLPSQIRAGDTLSYTLNFSDYPASTWDCTVFYRLGDKTVEQTATDNGDDKFLVSHTDSETREFNAGGWRWWARVSKLGEGSIIADEGKVSVLPDPGGIEPDSHAKAMLKAVQAVQSKRAGKAYNSADLAGTSFQYKTDAELRAEEQHWLGRVNMENRRKNAREDGGARSTGRIRFRPSC